jgi:hypothetical protein
MTNIDDSQATVASLSNTIVSEIPSDVSMTDSQMEEMEYLKCIPDSMDLFDLYGEKEEEVTMNRKELKPTLLENVDNIVRSAAKRKVEDIYDPIESSDDEQPVIKENLKQTTKRNKLILIEIK